MSSTCGGVTPVAPDATLGRLGNGASTPPGNGRVTTQRLQSLERGLMVLRSFGADAPSLTISEVADRTGLTRATARRILLTLEELATSRRTAGRSA